MNNKLQVVSEESIYPKIKEKYKFAYSSNACCKMSVDGISKVSGIEQKRIQKIMTKHT